MGTWISFPWGWIFQSWKEVWRLSQLWYDADEDRSVVTSKNVDDRLDSWFIEGNGLLFCATSSHCCDWYQGNYGELKPLFLKPRLYLSYTTV